MSLADSKSVARTAQQLLVFYRKASGTPPVYSPDWLPVWGAKVDRIEINRDDTPSVATIWFPQLRWSDATGLNYGDMIKVTTAEPLVSQRTNVFIGFYVTTLSDFSGGSIEQGSAFERNAIVCLDHRWLLSSVCPIFGQLARSPDHYSSYGSSGQAPVDGKYFLASGRRCIFNENGKANKDSDRLVVLDTDDLEMCRHSIFADPSFGSFWSARDMMYYILSPLNNLAFDYFPLTDPSEVSGLAHSDWDRILNNICIDGLDIIKAISLVCKHLGWGYRLDFHNDDTAHLVFCKPGSASAYIRDDDNNTILHRLYTPAVNESVSVGVQSGRKILWSANLSRSVSRVVNNPWGIGFPDRFEFTAELVPAWLDADLVPDSAESYKNLFFQESELQDMTDPDTYSFFKKYHIKGSEFNRDVGRKWALNETGRYCLPSIWTSDRFYAKGDFVRIGAANYQALSDHYSSLSDAPPSSKWQSLAAHYDRGSPFNFASYVPAEFILDSEGQRLFGPFARKLLDCLTIDKNSNNSIGIKAEFSFDGGVSWQTFNCAISNLSDEAGIYIEEPNLAEMVDLKNGTIASGDLAGKAINFFSSLCDDKVNSRIYKSGQWKTRVRITASVQMDRRLARSSAVDPRTSGSPFHHSQVYDFSEKYGLQKRTSSSRYNSSELPAWNRDDRDWCDHHLGGIRKANEDASISGQFTLERLWLGDGAGEPDFAIGDCIEKIDGRNVWLGAAFAGKTIYPEIVKIIYLPDPQRMQLLTRDLRFVSEVNY